MHKFLKLDRRWRVTLSLAFLCFLAGCAGSYYAGDGGYGGYYDDGYYGDGYGPYWDDWGPDAYVFGGYGGYGGYRYGHGFDHEFGHRGFASRNAAGFHGNGGFHGGGAGGFHGGGGFGGGHAGGGGGGHGR